MGTASLGHRYVEYSAAAATSNIVVDGAPNPATQLVLSHWPGNRTPAPLRRDLSAEIAFAYLDHPEFHRAGLPVTNNHLDEDGLVSVATLVLPEFCLAHRERLVEVARAGDFEVTRDDVAARIAFAVGAGAVTGYDDLDTFAELVEHPERFERAWRGEWDRLEDGRAQVASGAVTVEPVPELDLSVVRVHRPGDPPPHPMAVHERAPHLRVLTLSPAGRDVRLRYETWVDLQSPHAPRVDLGPLAEELTRRDSVTWVFDGVDSITPRLHTTGGRGSLPDDDFVDSVVSYLQQAA